MLWGLIVCLVLAHVVGNRVGRAITLARARAQESALNAKPRPQWWQNSSGYLINLSQVRMVGAGAVADDGGAAVAHAVMVHWASVPGLDDAPGVRVETFASPEEAQACVDALASHLGPWETCRGTR